MKETKRLWSDQDRLELVARRIAEGSVDITSQYKDWIAITFACASLGEAAREAYHTICAQYNGYSREECDQCFDNCLRTGRGDITLGTLMKLAQDHGVDTAMPRGPRPRTRMEEKEERANQFEEMCRFVSSRYAIRFNTWKKRVELRELTTDEWRPMNERDLNTIYTRLRQNGISVKQNDVKAFLESKDFAENYDAVKEWLDSLPPYDPATQTDYIYDFFAAHLIFANEKEAPFCLQMLKKWFVGMVALWRGDIRENPLMPVLCGPQHIGKTYFIRHILPPQLREYYKEPSPRDPVDKDFIISLSEVVMIFMDEFSISSDSRSNAYKSIITSSQSNLRDAFGHYREVRERKASLIGATNYKHFIRESEGNRRYLGVELAGTVNLNDSPLPYEDAFAQALWMLDNGYDPKPTQEESALISHHNANYMEANDCEEALGIFVRKPSEGERGEAYSSGELLQELNNRGFHGQAFNVVAIGRTMRRLGILPRKVNGYSKYLVVLLDYNQQKCRRIDDTAEILQAESNAEGKAQAEDDVI